jgi:hypothetical protein
MVTLQQVYLLRDDDLQLYKIGIRGDKIRFLSETSNLRNGYVTNIYQIKSSGWMSKSETKSLEDMLHKLYEDKNVPYPTVTLTQTLPDGSIITKEKKPKGHTEWFRLSEDDVNDIIDILTNS